MNSLVFLIDTVLNLYVWCLIIVIAMGWLIHFKVINTHNQLVATVYEFLHKITEPVLRYIRRYVPSFGGFDLSPIILILAIWFARSLMREYLV